MQTPMMNPGLMAPVQMDGFARAFEAGQQRQREEAQRNALAALAMNPSDPQAQASAARFAPQAVMQARQQEAEAATKQVEAYRDTISKGAEMLQRLTSQGVPKQQAAQMVRQTLIANRFPGADQIPEQMDDQYIDGIIALADTNAPQDPGIIREFDIARSRGLIPAETTFQQYATLRNPGSQTPVILPHNISPVGGTAVAEGGVPSVSSPQEAMALPPGTQFRLPDGRIGTVPGGAGGNASGGFPGN